MRHPIRVTLIAAASVLALAACSTTDTAVEAVPEETTVSDSEASDMAAPSAFELAMTTVEGLIDDGAEQVAISRLTQLLGNPALTDEEIAETLLRRGELRFAPRGYNTMGAIDDFTEIVDNYGDTDVAEAAEALRDTARGKATSLNFLLSQPETTRSARFDALMELGNFEDAKDMMMQMNLTPSNEVLVAMYQIGYLCDDAALTGRAYETIDTDGTERMLRFCDLGK